jgi:hypothetical protein
MFGAIQPPWYLVGGVSRAWRKEERRNLQFPHVVRRLVVPANQDREHRRRLLAGVVSVRCESERTLRLRGRRAHLLVEAAELLVLVWDGHGREVLHVPDGLEVAADEEEVDGVGVLALERADALVDRVELAVAAALDGDLRTREEA